MAPPRRCLSCNEPFKSNAALGRHLGNTLECQQFFDKKSTEEAAQVGMKRNNATPVCHTRTSSLEFLAISDDLVPTTGPKTRSQKRPRVTVEEVEDEEADAPWQYMPFPGEPGQTFGEDVTMFESLRAAQVLRGEHPHAPFQDDEEWGLAKWLMREVTQGGVDSFAKLPIVSEKQSSRYLQ